jgi:hypothetical protein
MSGNAVLIVAAGNIKARRRDAKQYLPLARRSVLPLSCIRQAFADRIRVV